MVRANGDRFVPEEAATMETAEEPLADRHNMNAILEEVYRLKPVKPGQGFGSLVELSETFELAARNLNIPPDKAQQAEQELLGKIWAERPGKRYNPERD